MNDARIEQFRKMAKANPDDDLAHFALGQALIDGERHAEAVNVLRHVVRVNEGYSRAWLLLGEAQAAVDDVEAAIESWQRGHEVALRRGDLMPAKDLAARLAEHGAPPPEEPLVIITGGGAPEALPEDDREPGEGEVRDLRTRRIGKRLTFDPFGDAVGAFIQDNVSQESWDAWMEMSVKIINELRLDLADPDAQRVYDEHMRDFLDLPGALFVQG